MQGKGLADKKVAEDKKLKVPISMIREMEEVQKVCQGISEEEFYDVVTNKIKNKCLEGDIRDKKFLAEVFQLIHDNIYGSSKVHNNIA